MPANSIGDESSIIKPGACGMLELYVRDTRSKQLSSSTRWSRPSRSSKAGNVRLFPSKCPLAFAWKRRVWRVPRGDQPGGETGPGGGGGLLRRTDRNAIGELRTSLQRSRSILGLSRLIHERRASPKAGTHSAACICILMHALSVQ